MSATEALCECLRLALKEERGQLIVALYELPPADLEKLVEAVQLIDSEGVEILDAYEQEAKSEPLTERVAEAKEALQTGTEVLYLLHRSGCQRPDVVLDCKCGANRHCRSCGYGQGQTPCKCRPARVLGNDGFIVIR